MNIAWYSRHAPTSRQLASLRSLYGNDVSINQDTRAFDSADLIAERYRSSKADDLVVVAPLSVVQALVRRGVQPIWAEMECVASNHPNAEVRIKSRVGRVRYYRFIQFWRVRDIKLDLAPVEPAVASMRQKAGI